MASTKKQLYSFFIAPEQLEGLRVLQQRDGVGVSEQIRRAVDAWLRASERRQRRRDAGQAGTRPDAPDRQT